MVGGWLTAFVLFDGTMILDMLRMLINVGAMIWVIETNLIDLRF